MKEKLQLDVKVEWSDEDSCYIGSALPFIGHCCDGDDPYKVLISLLEILKEITTLKQEEKN